MSARKSLQDAQPVIVADVAEYVDSMGTREQTLAPRWTTNTARDYGYSVSSDELLQMSF